MKAAHDSHRPAGWDLSFWGGPSTAPAPEPAFATHPLPREHHLPFPSFRRPPASVLPLMVLDLLKIPLLVMDLLKIITFGDGSMKNNHSLQTSD